MIRELVTNDGEMRFADDAEAPTVVLLWCVDVGKIAKQVGFMLQEDDSGETWWRVFDMQDQQVGTGSNFAQAVCNAHSSTGAEWLTVGSGTQMVPII
jgi:hypothetical protein